MDVKRQKKQIQLKLPFIVASRGETPKTAKRVETSTAKHTTERPAEIKIERLMEEVVNPMNLSEALKRVIQNKGSPGIDGMTVRELHPYLEENWFQIDYQLLNGTYQPQPVKRVEIPKSGGGVRKLGIPTVIDRLIQQMLLQVLQVRWDSTFSQYSYGFRPGRSAHQAIAQAQEYIEEGYYWVVDIDLEKFFDRVNHDTLMGLLSKRVKDKRVLKVIRAFLNAGVMERGLVSNTNEGTPQGGPLSPLLSNIILDVLDRELEKRNHKFVRYADDSNIYVQSKRAGDRVMESITRFLECKLKLKVNQQKSAVARVNERKFLGFRFIIAKRVLRGIAPEALKRFKNQVRQITRRSCGKCIEKVIKELLPYLRGWVGYFRFCETTSELRSLDSWIRHRLRCMLWKQWKTPKKRSKELRQRGLKGKWVKLTAISSKGPWHISKTKSLCITLPNKYFDTIGLYRLASTKSA